MSVFSQMVRGVSLPPMVPVRQQFHRPRVMDVAGEVQAQLSRPHLASALRPGMRVGIAGGSRGIRNIALILAEVACFCRARGTEPFIFPAMGSHGGATAHGQREILESLGITEAACGCPILSSMETVQIGFTEEGHPIHIDKQAAQADGYIAVNRIKPHTAFRGEYESGIMKMLTIGLGKQKGAEVVHMAGFGEMHRLVPLFGRGVIKNSNLLFALAILENAYDETCGLHALLPQEIGAGEPKLLEQARSLMGSILLPEADVLVVDEIGKNISGDGADPNVSGKFLTPYASGGLCCKKRAALSLSQETHGSAAGVGLFDVVSRRLLDQTDFEATYPNAITNTELDAVKMPIVMDCDRDAIALAVKCCNGVSWKDARIVRIRNTACLERIMVSEPLLDRVRMDSRLEIAGPPAPFPFDGAGNLF